MRADDPGDTGCQVLDLVRQLLQGCLDKSSGGPVSHDLEKDGGWLQQPLMLLVYSLLKNRLKGCLTGCLTESELG